MRFYVCDCVLVVVCVGFEELRVVCEKLCVFRVFVGFLLVMILDMFLDVLLNFVCVCVCVFVVVCVVNCVFLNF